MQKENPLSLNRGDSVKTFGIKMFRAKDPRLSKKNVYGYSILIGIAFCGRGRGECRADHYCRGRLLRPYKIKTKGRGKRKTYSILKASAGMAQG